MQWKQVKEAQRQELDEAERKISFVSKLNSTTFRRKSYWYTFDTIPGHLLLIATYA